MRADRIELVGIKPLGLNALERYLAQGLRSLQVRLRLG
jgi:hypothetical protein